ncbi:hypothetical protein K0U07_03005 [bacterium]|nr:hypothetical protein [bacterium]
MAVGVVDLGDSSLSAVSSEKIQNPNNNLTLKVVAVIAVLFAIIGAAYAYFLRGEVARLQGAQAETKKQLEEAARDRDEARAQLEEVTRKFEEARDARAQLLQDILVLEQAMAKEFGEGGDSRELPEELRPLWEQFCGLKKGCAVDLQRVYEGIALKVDLSKARYVDSAMILGLFFRKLSIEKYGEKQAACKQLEEDAQKLQKLEAKVRIAEIAVLERFNRIFNSMKILEEQRGESGTEVAAQAGLRVHFEEIAVLTKEERTYGQLVAAKKACHKRVCRKVQQLMKKAGKIVTGTNPCKRFKRQVRENPDLTPSKPIQMELSRITGEDPN